MANEEHVRIALSGCDAIAEWRRQHPGNTFDLRGAQLASENLPGANLTGAYLGGAYLRGVNLSGADFRRADLGAANVSGANLIGANLSGAELITTDLSVADLSGADLTSAKLNGANLSSADLVDADLTGATFAMTVLGDLDLSVAIGLDSVLHRSASSIGIDTILRSRAKIPDVFLRGCGVPEDIIAYIPSLVGKVFDFYSCFISHSTKNQEFTKRLHARLQQEKLRVWFAPEDMKGGHKIDDQIDQAIRLHDKLLLVLSSESMSSEWVMTEIRRTRKAEKEQGRQKLFPIRLCEIDALRAWKCFDADSGKDLAVEVREYHIPDFSNWKDHDSFEAAFKKLLHDLRKDEPTAPPMASAD